MKRSMKYCILCDNENNAIGKYYLKRRNKEQYLSGWIPVCKNCSVGISLYFGIEYFEKTEEVKCNHKSSDYSKKNLVTINDGDLRDIWKCKVCGHEIRSLGNPKL